MATSSNPLKPQSWPFEYKGWKITYYAYPSGSVPPRGFPAYKGEINFAPPKIEHIHLDEQQLVRWTKKRKKIDLKKINDYYPEGEEEQLCCFVCAEYMPDKVYKYFERCKEMVKCTLEA